MIQSGWKPLLRPLIIPTVTGHDEGLELELFDSGGDIVTDRHTPRALDKRIAVRTTGE